MIEIPFTKLHGAENDFLLTWGDAAPVERRPEIARRICSRTAGIGADGWMLAWPAEGGMRTQLFNPDGSEPEVSGNGTRCAAAFAIAKNLVLEGEVSIVTGAGPKQIRLISRDGLRFQLEMNMGLAQIEELRGKLQLGGDEFDATILNVGNPQCAIVANPLPENWREIAQLAQALERFPQSSNISFFRVVDRHAIEVFFYERGAGETRSSGTGATGAAIAAILRGEADSPVEIRTRAGALTLRWDDSVYLTGPAELIGEGQFFLDAEARRPLKNDR